jgi:cupin fold WbuC family metalloprotein
MIIYSKAQRGLLLHIINRAYEITEKRKDLVPADQFIQVASFKLQKGKTFLPHRHIDKPGPPLVVAQESWIVLKGRVKCIFYDVDGTHIGNFELGPGDCSITLHGGHNYEALEDDTVIYEAKTGPYSGQHLDKEFI